MLLDLGLISAVAGEPKLAGDGPAGAVEGALPISALAEFRALVDALAGSVPAETDQNPDAAGSDPSRPAASKADAPSEHEHSQGGSEAEGLAPAPPADVPVVSPPFAAQSVIGSRTTAAPHAPEPQDDRVDAGREAPVVPGVSAAVPVAVSADHASIGPPSPTSTAPATSLGTPASPSSATSTETLASPVLGTQPASATGRVGQAAPPAEDGITTATERETAPTPPVAALELDRAAPHVQPAAPEGQFDSLEARGDRVPRPDGSPALRLVPAPASSSVPAQASETPAANDPLVLDAAALAAPASSTEARRFALVDLDASTGHGDPGGQESAATKNSATDHATGEPAASPRSGLSRTTARLSAYVAALRGSHSDSSHWTAAGAAVPVSVQPDARQSDAARAIWPALPVAPGSTSALRAAETFTLRAQPGAAEAPLPEGAARQIVQALRLQWSRGVGEAQIRLQPDHLGQLSVSLRVERGHVVARLEADAPAVREWLNANQATLRQSLAEHHLTLDRLEVAEPAAEPAPEEKARDHRGDREPAPRRRREHPHGGERFEVVV